MKKLWCICCAAWSFFACVQAQVVNDSLSFVDGMPVEVGMRVTTNLLFHYKIKQVDRGHGDLMAKICNDTVLLLKAGREHFPPTNLSVYTADGKLHAFLVRFASAPVHLWMRLPGAGGAGLPMTQDSLEYYCNKVRGAPRDRHRLRDQRYRLRWQLEGLYARSSLLFFRFRLSNHSAIDYEPGSIRFLIRDKRRIKRTATQEREIQPVYVAGNMDPIAADSAREWVFALPAFVVPGKRALRMVIAEKNGGGRDMWIDLGSRRLSGADRID
jgi:conjugative transposon TraN protein